MDAIRRIVMGRGARSSPLCPRVPTDEVIPLFFFDDTPYYRNAVGCWTLRFNDVLDADRLHAALARLLEIDGWRKLGGRFRLSDKNKLEVHIPKGFSEDRPAVNYSHKSFDIAIDEHAVAASYPDGSQQEHTPSLKIPEANIWDLGLPPSTPKGIDDYLNSDSPQLSLHVTSFTDATLVSLCWPHVSADAIGLRDLARAWGLVLAGRAEEVLPMLSFRHDPMATAGCDPKFQDKHAQEHLLLRGLWLIIFGIRYLLDLLWWPRMQGQGMFLSRQAVQSLTTAAVASLPVPKPFISDGDVISAWVSSMAASVLPSTSRRPVIISNAFDLRGRAPSLFPATEDQGSYVQNAIFPISTLIPAHDLCSDTGLGPAALEVRRTIESESREGQVHALARLNRQSIAETGLIPIFGDTSAFIVILSNWTKARVFQSVDFGPAVISRRSGTMKGSRSVESKPVHFHIESVSANDIFARNTLMFVETPSGGYYISGYLPPVIWSKMEKVMSRY